jgi:hypothetical protein
MSDDLVEQMRLAAAQRREVWKLHAENARRVRRQYFLATVLAIATIALGLLLGMGLMTR